MKATFDEVGLAIKSERNYQDDKWVELDKVNQPDDFISYIEKYVIALREAPPELKQDFFRKVAALGVVAMEKFGAPHRKGYELCGEKACANCPMDESCKSPDAQVLTPEELDALVADGQVVQAIDRGIWYRVEETSRTYHYDDGDGGTTQHTFLDVRAFAVMPSGGHRLIDKTGTGYYVQPGWRVLAVPDLETV